jgi:predicted HicB family RNase H-like nuclease
MVRLSTEEHAATSRAAQARGLTWSAWAREALLFVAENCSDLKIDMGEDKNG